VHRLLCQWLSPPSGGDDSAGPECAGQRWRGTPVLAKVPGLISKIWLADEEKNTFGDFYLWENKTAMEDFMHSDLVKSVVSRPFVKNVSSVDFEVNQNASFITRGLK
jgi:hypothetical protein